MSRFLACIIIVTSFCGCVSVKNERSIVPPPALISVVRAPLTAPAESIGCENLKRGVAADSFYIWEYLLTGINATVWAATLDKAMQSGKLSKLHYADYEMTSILGYITIFTVTAYGE
jgi:hypothetical protein